MQIEKAEPARMTTTGSALLRSLQNNNTPILDLLVRESIQNSLDAAIKNEKSVRVDFYVSTFKSNEFNEFFDGIKDGLHKKYPNRSYSYIAIKDTKTTGLTGPLYYKDVKNNVYGNLLKLVYEIQKPQNEAGAGGSWGLGKTVYFRVSEIGMVIYYSRIINEKGKYESRLAATLVEDENSKKCLIPSTKDSINRGIAWWGQEFDKNKTVPITKEKEIQEILDVLGLDKFGKEQTGTMVIIPYINEEALLNHNKSSESSIRTPWDNNLNDYLTVAIQRWYSARLGNDKYKYGPYLEATVGGEKIVPRTMAPVFSFLQNLYIRATGPAKKKYYDSLDYNKITVYRAPIIIRKYLENTEAGVLTFAKINRKYLGMDAPDNLPDPYSYFDVEKTDEKLNNPIVCFTRKPAMIVSYETTDKWVQGIPSSNLDEFIIGIFVPNSENNLKDGIHFIDSENINTGFNDSFEEYLRKSELADHKAWTDYSIIVNGKNDNPGIVKKIQNQVSTAIKNTFQEVQKNTDKEFNTLLGEKFGKLVLPPQSFGSRPTPRQTAKSSEPKTGNSIKKSAFKIENDQIEYISNKIVIPATLNSSKPISTFLIELRIDSGDSADGISYTEWETVLNQDLPFAISDIKLTNVTDPDNKYEIELNDKTPSVENEEVSYELQTSTRGKYKSLYIKSKNSTKLKATMEITLESYNKMYRPTFFVKTNKEEL